MASSFRTGLASCALGLMLAACGGGGGGDRAPGVETGPVPPNGPIIPPSPEVPSSDIDAAALTEADQVVATITGVSIASPPTVTFVLVANGLQIVSGLDSSMLRASFSRLQSEPEFGGLDWLSLVNTSEDPVCRTDDDKADPNNQCTETSDATTPEAIDDAARKVQDPVATGKTVRSQATTEGGDTLTGNDDGSWSYTLITDPGEPATLETMHRVCLQISLAAPTNNACIDFVPADLVNPAIGDAATSLDDEFYQNYPSQQVVADASCNSCHAELAFHGARTAMDYCVTCHNSGTTDANSENSVDFKVMVHRIHNGRNLPSNSGENPVPYKIWGYRNGEYDYSNVSYPQKIIQCTRCHAGNEDLAYAEDEGLPMPRATVTPDGHNWVTYPGRASCESCHDDKTEHGNNGEQACTECHDNVADRHRDAAEDNARSLSLEIESVTGTGAGEQPVVVFNVQRDGQALDIKNPEEFDGKLKIGVAWDAATDFDNEGISGTSSLNIEIDPVSNSTALGDNRFELDTASANTPIPPGKDTLGIMLFGHERYQGDDNALSPIESTIEYAKSEAGEATPRRQVADIDKCDSCHHRLAMTDYGHVLFHASPAEKLELCAGCHGPGLGFSGFSTDFRVLVHGVHASAMRETPYRGSFDTSRVQYPGNLADCESCHLSGTQLLPTPVATGPLKDGSDSEYSTAVASTCASCHDGDSAQAHMVNNGGAVFKVSQEAAAAAVETCDVCHKTGASAGVDQVHNK